MERNVSFSHGFRENGDCVALLFHLHRVVARALGGGDSVHEFHIPVYVSNPVCEQFVKVNGIFL